MAVAAWDGDLDDQRDRTRSRQRGLRDGGDVDVSQGAWHLRCRSSPVHARGAFVDRRRRVLSAGCLQSGLRDQKLYHVDPDARRRRRRRVLGAPGAAELARGRLRRCRRVRAALAIRVRDAFFRPAAASAEIAHGERVRINFRSCYPIRRWCGLIWHLGWHGCWRSCCP